MGKKKTKGTKKKQSSKSQQRNKNRRETQNETTPTVVTAENATDASSADNAVNLDALRKLETYVRQERSKDKIVTIEDWVKTEAKIGQLVIVTNLTNENENEDQEKLNDKLGTIRGFLKDGRVSVRVDLGLEVDDGSSEHYKLVSLEPSKINLYPIIIGVCPLCKEDEMTRDHSFPSFCCGQYICMECARGIGEKMKSWGNRCLFCRHDLTKLAYPDGFLKAILDRVKRDDPEANCLMAMHFLKTKITSQGGLSFLHKAADGGYVRAMLMLGMVYYGLKIDTCDADIYDLQIPRDVVVASKYLMMAANQGCVVSMRLTGKIYAEGGEGLPKSLVVSTRYFEMGAKRVDPDCMRFFGTALIRGDGIEKNQDVGFHYIKASADAGNSGALFHYALICPKATNDDLTKSIECMEKSLKAGFKYAEDFWNNDKWLHSLYLFRLTPTDVEVNQSVRNMLLDCATMIYPDLCSIPVSTSIESDLQENPPHNEAEICTTTQKIELPEDEAQDQMTENHYQPQDDIVYIGSTYQYPVILDANE